MSAVFLEAQMEMSLTPRMEDSLVDGQQVPVPKEWGAEAMKLLSREIATLNERLSSMEERMKTCVTQKQLEVKAAETRDHFKCLGNEIHQMENRISDSFRHESALRKALSKMLSEELGTDLENRANDIEKLQEVCPWFPPDAVVPKWKSAAELPEQALLEKALLQSQNSAIPEVSNVGSQPRPKVKSRKSDALAVPDVVGTKWESLVEDVSELQALVKQEVLQRQFSVGRVLDFSADLEFRKSLSRESLALLARQKALMVGHPLSASTSASKTSDGSTSPDDGSTTSEVAPCPKPRASIMVYPPVTPTTGSKASDGSTTPDDQSTNPDDWSTKSAPIYSTRTSSSEPFGGSCKDFVARIKNM
jgi:hypothetical protein